MREDFLHFIWRFARFDLRELRTTTGARLSIQDFGRHNTDGGPDFSNGQVRIEGMQWAGNVEIHVNASDWYAHGHQTDPAYDGVVLHVVYDEDRPVFRPNGERIPCLELRGRVHPGLLSSYHRLTHSATWVPCQHRLFRVGETVRSATLDAVLTERLADRADRFRKRWEYTGRDWEEAYYQSLARALGGRVNADAMDMLARSLPLRTLLKHKHSLLQLEALLFGQSGLLPEAAEGETAYVTLLRREYSLLRTKYELRPLPRAAWRYLRLRPNNFPTVRIAQFATMLHRTGQLFGKTLAAASARELMNMFAVKLSNYWRTHYRFGKETAAAERSLGATTIRSVLINTAVPALIAYGKAREDERYRDRAHTLLAELPPEDNRPLRKWAELGWPAGNAAESQALLQLKAEHCDRSRCLECPVGQDVLANTYGEDDAPLLSVNEQTVVYGGLT